MWPQTALQINGSGEVETHRRGSVRPASMLATEGATLIRRIRKSARALSVANNQNFISWRKARANKNQRAQQRKLRPKGSVSRGADSCWYCSSGISSDASLSKSQRYAGEPVEVKRPTESGAQNTLRATLIFVAACRLRRESWQA